jgi:hypothetical protein
MLNVAITPLITTIELRQKAVLKKASTLNIIKTEGRLRNNLLHQHYLLERMIRTMNELVQTEAEEAKLQVELQNLKRKKGKVCIKTK